jgi:hypothetical protein
MKSPGKQKNRTAIEAKRLSISVDLLRDLFHAGIVPGLKISPKVILFNPIETDRALKEQFSKKATTRQKALALREMEKQQNEAYEAHFESPQDMMP